MCPDHDLFLQAIHEKKLVDLTFHSYEKGTITRKCVCYDYAPGNRYKDGLMRYHFCDLDSPDGRHNLSILPQQVQAIKILGQNFDPGDYITWKANWSVTRDWGIHS